MIHSLFIFNRAGKPRLVRWWSHLDRHKIEPEIMKIALSRDARSCNFVEYGQWKIVFRRYAGLVFATLVDSTENELAILEFIQLYVEALDGYFGNVCELDLVFQFNKCLSVLDEMVLGGEIGEVSVMEVLKAVKASDMLD